MLDCQQSKSWNSSKLNVAKLQLLTVIHNNTFYFRVELDP